jgi:sulfatase modifying factor 1
MLSEKFHWIARQYEPTGDPRKLFESAYEFEQAGNLETAATIYDLAYGLDPAARDLQFAREKLLDQLAVVEHGLRFRYIPGGLFLMGSDSGEPDERPCHAVGLSPYWISETPISWNAFQRLCGPESLHSGHPLESKVDQANYYRSMRQGDKLRSYYCREIPWEMHGRQAPVPGDSQPYEKKPMVAVAWQDVEEVASQLSTNSVGYSLPTEAQWEKAGRGGLIGASYAWGDAPPDQRFCDFNRFREYQIQPMRSFPPNGYGLYAMCGGVWEWTSDWYDRDYYQNSPETDPRGPATGEEKVLRGGSWADCADAVSVSFRMSRGSCSSRDGKWGAHLSPTIGFRLCRKEIM